VYLRPRRTFLLALTSTLSDLGEPSGSNPASPKDFLTAKEHGFRFFPCLVSEVHTETSLNWPWEWRMVWPVAGTHIYVASGPLRGKDVQT